MKKYFGVIIIILIILVGCSQATQVGNPDWVEKLIKQYESEPVGDPPLSIRRYEYQGQVVYFVSARCCDIYSILYDADGNVLCAPSGGIAGAGDGRCTDFFNQRTNEQLIWQDPR
jgi:hypothetical protein